MATDFNPTPSDPITTRRATLEKELARVKLRADQLTQRREELRKTNPFGPFGWAWKTTDSVLKFLDGPKCSLDDPSGGLLQDWNVELSMLGEFVCKALHAFLRNSNQPTVWNINICDQCN